MVEAHKAKLKAISQVETAAAARKAALADAQDVAEVVVDAEARLGALLGKTEFTKGGRGKTGSTAGTTLHDIGIDKKMSHQAQQIHKHPEEVEQCKNTAQIGKRPRIAVGVRSVPGG